MIDHLPIAIATIVKKMLRYNWNSCKSKNLTARWSPRLFLRINYFWTIDNKFNVIFWIASVLGRHKDAFQNKEEENTHNTIYENNNKKHHILKRVVLCLHNTPWLAIGEIFGNIDMFLWPPWSCIVATLAQVRGARYQDRVLCSVYIQFTDTGWPAAIQRLTWPLTASALRWERHPHIVCD